MGDAEKAINISELEELKRQLPDDEKTGNIRKVLNYILTAVKSGWSLTRVVQDVKSLQDIQQYKKDVGDLFDKLTQENSRCNEKIAKELEEHSKNCSRYFSRNTFSIDDIRKVFSQNKAASVEKIREDVLNAIDEHHRRECNKVIQDMVKGSRVMAALYVLKLYKAWKNISAASNVIEDKNKFRQIENNIKELGEMVAGLVTICSTDTKHESINDRMMLITTTYTATLGLISDVRVKIDGHIQSLDLLGYVAAVDSAMSFATAVAQGYEVWNAWDNLTSLTKWQGVASTAVFTLFGMANAGVYLLTRQKLKQLREDLSSVTRFKCDLDELFNKARRAIAERTA